jgi:hypothetical protein
MRRNFYLLNDKKVGVGKDSNDRQKKLVLDLAIFTEQENYCRTYKESPGSVSLDSRNFFIETYYFYRAKTVRGNGVEKTERGGDQANVPVIRTH